MKHAKHANHSNNYPVNGSLALKPQVRSERATTGVVVEFPSADRAEGARSRTRSLSITERINRMMTLDGLRGKEFETISRKQELLAGMVLAAVSTAIVLLSL